mgnify:CR=1 FL=1
MRRRVRRSATILPLFCLPFLLCFLPDAEARMVFPQEVELIGELIFQNECSGKESKLLTWNEGEDFPSFGIGHFIWYPAGEKGPFHESFPMLMAFMQKSGVELPEWFNSVPGKHAPWKNREDFLKTVLAGELDFLRDFLAQTKISQAQFLIDRFRQAIPKILETAPSSSREQLRQKLFFLLNASGGLYPLVDYVNSSGEGTLETERYQGYGWGLLQVLEEMRMPADGQDSVAEFVKAAETVLQRRVDHSPPERNEIRWLPGWKNRVRTYLTAQGPEGSKAVRALNGAPDEPPLSERTDLINLDEIIPQAGIGR